MKKLVSLCVLLSAACAFGQLDSATGNRLVDYQNWFGEFQVASDDTYPGDPSPPSDLPAANLPTWSGWFPNWGDDAIPPALIENNILDPKKILRVEYVFLGETAGWKNTWGYRLNGTDVSPLATNIQSVGSLANITFGDFGSVELTFGQTLDFFITGVGSTGGTYFVIDPSDNEPGDALMQSYFGTLLPGEGNTARDPLLSFPEYGFTVIGFEDIQIGEPGGDADYNDFIFAYRAFEDDPQAPVPEPSTYGLLAAMLLIFLAEYRRRKAV